MFFMNKIEFAGKRAGENFRVTEENIDEIVEKMQRNGNVFNKTSRTLDPIDIPPDWLVTKPESEKTEAEKAFDKMFIKHLSSKRHNL